MKVAIVHDQLLEFGGAERVLVALKRIFPKAQVFTSAFDINRLGNHKKVFKNWKITSSWFGKIPILKYYYSPLRFLTPLIWESFKFDEFDLVISSTGSWMCKGIKTSNNTFHISYIHHPPRYLYYYETAVEWQKYLPVRVYGHFINHFLRQWDFIASQRPDILVANSEETRRRIKKFYKRDAVVIYPPVGIAKEVDFKRSLEKKQDYYITVSRLARAKHVDLLCEAAIKAGVKFKVVGTGREEKALREKYGKKVEFLGNVDDKALQKLLSQAKAFLFASVEEEFGIAPVEALGWGAPVIAYASGGVVEYVKEGKNGFLYDKLEVEALVEKIKEFEGLPAFRQKQLRLFARKTAERFSFERFRKRTNKLIVNLGNI